jgi:hypothetical protein
MMGQDGTQLTPKELAARQMMQKGGAKPDGSPAPKSMRKLGWCFIVLLLLLLLLLLTFFFAWNLNSSFFFFTIFLLTCRS